jgi:3-oxoacyl-[acyl-carrier protein] reductase
VDLGLKGKVALVAAASRGLGRAIAAEMANEGANLVICARNSVGLTATAKAIASSTGVKVHAVVADVSKQKDIDRVTGEALAKFGRVDVLVTNAGGPPAGVFENHSWEVWESAVNLTLRSVVEMTRAVLPGMKERKWGRIINVTSIAVKQPVDNLMLSNSLRSAVTGFARTLANEVATSGVTVNNILPGYTRTERVEALADSTAAKEGLDRKDIVARFENEIPMRRLGESEELAALATFLASERAGYITAQSIAVDGGWIRSLL